MMASSYHSLGLVDRVNLLFSALIVESSSCWLESPWFFYGQLVIAETFLGLRFLVEVS